MCDDLIERSYSGIVRWCADDSSAILRRLQDLVKLADVFHTIEECSCLQLKPAKCVIVWLSSKLTKEKLDDVRNFLMQHVPQWADFKIDDKAEYLG
eukprot:11729156-Karenia_brevis.AAC.1